MVLVSVTLPVFNGETFLAQAIDSVIAQSLPSWELLVVDDGSTDRTAEIAAAYAGSDPERIRVLCHPGRVNRGMMASRDLGLAHSRGRYVARLDADDVLRPTAFEDQVAILESHPEAAMVYGPVEIWRSWAGDGPDVFQEFSVPLDTVLPPPQVVCAFLARGGDEPVGMFVRRTALEEVRGYAGVSLEGDLYEDIALNVKLCLRHPVVASSRSWYRYRQHQESYCSTARRRGNYDVGIVRFLEWVGSYLDELGEQNDAVWRNLRGAIRRHAASMASVQARQAAEDFDLTAFDERAYLAANPDVAQAVLDGRMSSGQSHFVSWGFREARPAAPPLRRAGNDEGAVRVLVAGWFSFPHGLATAGDVQACTVVRRWLTRAGYPCDVAVDRALGEGVRLEDVNPLAYSHVVFVCGPFGDYRSERAFLARFQASRLIGVNLSMVTDISRWNPFDVLFERDSSAIVRPDITFAAPLSRVPVVGVCLVEPWGYDLASIDAAEAVIARALARREVAPVAIDTRLADNRIGLRSAAEVESLLARMDVVVTTRLHGMVLALKNGVPVVAIDPRDTGKISRQAKVLEWPHIFTAGDVTVEGLGAAIEACLTPEARALAAKCAGRAMASVDAIRDDLLAALARGVPGVGRASSGTRAESASSGDLVPVSAPPDDLGIPRLDTVVFGRSRQARSHAD